jgi:hypothetical protein
VGGICSIVDYSNPQIIVVGAMSPCGERKNPVLTQAQVQEVICKSAQKVGAYTYQTDSLHCDSTWNNEMGYGLADANAAVV